MSTDITRLGQEAEYILSSEAYQQASEALEKSFLAAWSDGQFATVEQREEAFHRVRAARFFRDSLTAMLNGMKLSKAQAADREKRRRAAGRKPEDD